MKNTRLLSQIFLLLPTLLTASFALAQTCENKSDEALYDSLYPTYIQACAGTQEKPVDAGQGGSGGHSFMYIRGACRDLTSKYPKLKVCDASDKNVGVGVSVDQIFDNVNWVAIDNRDLFFRGNVDQCSPLTKDARQQTIRDVLARHIFQNVEIREDYKAKFENDTPRLKGLPTEEWLATEGIGTNIGINFHRNILCARVPLTKARIQKTVDYLNSLNEQYEGKKHFKWTLYYNNCAHVVHNALAAAGVFDFALTDANVIRQFANVIIPGNEFVDDQHAASDYDIDAISVYRDNKYAREGLMTDGWMPTQAGGIVGYIQIHNFQNEVAATDSKISLYSLPPSLEVYQYRFNKYLDFKTPAYKRYSDLRANLEYYRNLYTSLLQKPSDGRIKTALNTDNVPKDFNDFYNNHYAPYIQKQLNDVNEKLSKLP